MNAASPHTLDDFLTGIRTNFPELKVDSLSAETPVGELLEWSSLTVLMFLAYLAEVFDRKLTYAQVKDASTLGKLYLLLTRPE
jgi:hypothetical protein